MRRGDIFPMVLFQFTPLREGRRAGVCPARQRHHFNSRPSARGDEKHRELVALWDKFQFTPLREGRRTRLRFLPMRRIFQFTPLREGRLELQIFKGACPKFQFTPLREGRLSPPFIYS